MKRVLASILTTCIFALSLVACGKTEDRFTMISAMIMDGDHYKVEESMVTIEPNQAATFYVETDPGYSVLATDYEGAYSITKEADKVKLVLANVQYPTRVSLEVSNTSVTISYDANGGVAMTSEGKLVEREYNVSLHTRPNVSIGTDLFTRDGYTQTGWNTKADGSGTSVGLGSRMTVDITTKLYAQWAKWTRQDLFTYVLLDGNAMITGYNGNETCLVIPERLNGYNVTTIKANAFENCQADTVILPKTIQVVEELAFLNAKLSTLYFFDNVETISDASFDNCGNLATLHISAIEDPYGYHFRRESLFADKMDLLISTMGEDRLLFYGGCSMWYNLIGEDVDAQFGNQYRIVNIALNGVSSSLFQLEIILNYVTDRDVLVHTPELSSRKQLMIDNTLTKNEDKLWCALEYNYDLVAGIDIRVLGKGVFDTFKLYLDKKEPDGTYLDEYHDSKGYTFWNEYGCLPFERSIKFETLADSVTMNPAYLSDLSYLQSEYGKFTAKGLPIYVTYSCIDVDNLSEEDYANIPTMASLFEERIGEMDGVTLFGTITDFFYHDEDYYDSVYHLQTIQAKHCTEIWIRDLSEQLSQDGLWGGAR